MTFIGGSPFCGMVGSGTGSCVDILYADLVAKIGAGTLTRGQLYRITDFQTVHYLLDADGTQYTAKAAQVDKVTLSGNSGTVNVIDAGGLTELVTFHDDPETTAADFVTAYAVDYLAQGIILTRDGADLVFTALVAGTPFTTPGVDNAPVGLSGHVANTVPNSVMAQVDTLTLTGSLQDSTANVTGAGGLTKLATFNTSLHTTATNFVTAYADDYLAVGIVLSSNGPDLIFTASVSGVPFTSPILTNLTGNLYGSVVNTTPSAVAQVDTVTLWGDNGTAEITDAGSLTRTVTFNSDLATTASDFVAAFADDYLAVDILLTANGDDLIFTSNIPGTPFVSPAIANATHELTGTVTNYVANDDAPIIGPIEPLIVLAVAKNAIGEQAYSETYPKDVVYYDWNPDNWLGDLSFATGGETIIPGWKGVITFRHDTQNDIYAPGDWRAAKSRRWKTAATAWNKWTTYNPQDVVSSNNRVFVAILPSCNSEPTYDSDNWACVREIGWYEFWNPHPQSWNEIPSGVTHADLPLFYESTGQSVHFEGMSKESASVWTLLGNNVLMGASASSCTVGPDSKFNTISGLFERNRIGAGCFGNVIFSSASGNDIGLSFRFNNIGPYFSDNTIASQFQYNTISGGFAWNNIGIRFGNTNPEGWSGNIIGANFCYNRVGSDAMGNVIGTDVQGNDIGRGFNGNLIEGNFKENNIASSFGGNTIGKGFRNNNTGPAFFGNVVSPECFSNTFGATCYNNHIGEAFAYNSVAGNFTENRLGPECYGNIIGSYFSSNTTLGRFNNNETGNLCGSNIFGKGFVYNKLGISCMSNVFGDDCDLNFLGTAFANNIVGNFFSKNFFGMNCSSNTIGWYFFANTIGAGFFNNVIEDGFSNNNVGSECESNTIGVSAHHNTIGSYFVNNAIGTQFHSNIIGASFAMVLIADNFQWNNVASNTLGDFDLRSATHVYAQYSCELYTDKALGARLRYYNNDVAVYAAVTD